MRMKDTPYDAAMTRSKQELARQLVDANAHIKVLEKALREIKHITDDPDVAEFVYLALAPEQDK